MRCPLHITTGPGAVTTHENLDVSEIPEVGASGEPGRAVAIRAILCAAWHIFWRSKGQFSSNIWGDFTAGLCAAFLFLSFVFAPPFARVVVILGGQDGF